MARRTIDFRFGATSQAALPSASESVRKAKEKYEALFLKEQEEAVKTMKADYMHCTK